MSIRIITLSALVLSSMSMVMAKSDKDVHRFIEITAQGVYVLENGGRNLVKYSVDDLDQLDEVQLTRKGNSIVASDSKVVVVGKKGSDTEITLFNGDTLDELGQAQFELNSNASN